MNRASAGWLSLMLVLCACSGDSGPPTSTGGSDSAPATSAEHKALKALEKRAEAGDVTAIVELADLRATGTQMPIDLGAALAGYERAAEAGVGYAMLKAAQLHETGVNGAPTVEGARDWYIRATGAGIAKARAWVEERVDTDGACALALARLTAVDTPQNSDERKRAIELFGKAISAKAPGAEGELAELLLETEPPDFPRIRSLLANAVDADDLAAIDRLAQMHDEGWGVEPASAERAVSLWRKAAGLGSAKAMACVGRAHATGRGASQDVGQALDWLRKAELAGSALAKVELARFHLAGAGGVEKSVARGRELLEQAARQGDLEGMEGLGDVALADEMFPDLAHRFAERLAEMRSTIAAHRADAEEWYGKASKGRRLTAMKKAGDLYSIEPDGDEANMTLARMHYEPALAEIALRRRLGRYTKDIQELEGGIKAGYGIALFNRRSPGEGADRTAAIRWIDEAIALGNARGMALRGELCLFAIGNPLDLEQGLEWYLKAAKAGSPEGKIVVDGMTTRGRLDPKKTIQFYEALANGGDGRAARVVDEVKAQLAPQEPVKK